MAASFGFASCVHGYHVYQEIRTAMEGETLLCNRETRSREDPFAVAVMKSGEIVGHVPRYLSCVCCMFLRRGGLMACHITGGRQHSKDLPQGGLEVPCIYVFTGPSDIVDKTKQYLAEIKIQNVKQTSAEPKTESDAGDTNAKVKNDVVDLDGLQVSAEVTGSEIETHSGAWITVQDITLTEDDKQAVIDGKLLQDQHINCAQRLLNQQFLAVNGLQSSLIQDTSQSKDLLAMPCKSFMSGRTTGLWQHLIKEKQSKSMILFMVLWTRHQLQQ